MGPTAGVTVESWIFETNLLPFLKVLGWITKYDFDSYDGDAIVSGIQATDDEADKWYDYDFCGQDHASIALALSPGTGVVNYRIRVPTELSQLVKLAGEIFASYSLARAT